MSGYASSSPVLLLLDEYGLSELTPDTVENHVAQMPARVTRKLTRALRITLSQNECQPWRPRGDLNVFDFFAGSTVRGDAFCAALECQTPKLDMLGHFAALYADSVVLPVHLPDPNTPSVLAHAINALLRLRPLIETGLVLPRLHCGCLCHKCLVEIGVDVAALERKVERF